ncbi:MAG: HEAT repeat domain-containing protein [Candidatus Brocadiia bacterium]
MALSKRFSSYSSKKRSPLIDWVVKHSFRVLIATMLLLGLAANLVIFNWNSIHARWEIYRLHSLWSENSNDAYEQLRVLGDLAIPALLGSIENEKDPSVFNQEMFLIALCRKLPLVPMHLRVKYFVDNFKANDWSRTVVYLDALARIGKPAVPYLCRFIGTSPRFIEYNVLCILGRIKDPACAPVVSKLVASREEPISEKAMWILDECGQLKAYSYVVVDYITSERFREMSLRMMEYSVRILAKLASPDLDAKMRNYLDNGRPFETRLAASYFALSANLDNVRIAYEEMFKPEVEEEMRLSFLNALKDRRDEPAIQDMMIAYLDHKDGLARQIAAQVLIVGKLDAGRMARVKTIAEKSEASQNRWDAAIVLSYQNDSSVIPILAEAVEMGVKEAQFTRVSKQAAIALGESRDSSALATLVRLSTSGDAAVRIRAIWWGLRVNGKNEGDWKLSPEAKTVYPVLKAISEDVSAPIDVRRTALGALENRELVQQPGQEIGPQVIYIDAGIWAAPQFTGSGMSINSIIRERMGYFTYPDFSDLIAQESK